MIRGSWILALCMLVVVGTAAAVDRGEPNTNPPFVPQGECPTDGYKNVTDALPAPQIILPFDIGGVTLGPLNVDDDGDCMDDVTFFIEMDHTWIGDVKALLYYDLECDGTTDFGPFAALCRPGDGNGGCLDGVVNGEFGCDTDVAGVYQFSDDGAAALGDPGASIPDDTQCPLTAAPGCYALAPDTGGAGFPLSVLEGTAKGGCFTLFASDSEPNFDEGTISSWGVDILNRACAGTPTINATWGGVKSEFRSE